MHRTVICKGKRTCTFNKFLQVWADLPLDDRFVLMVFYVVDEVSFDRFHPHREHSQDRPERVNGNRLNSASIGLPPMEPSILIAMIVLVTVGHQTLRSAVMNPACVFENGIARSGDVLKLLTRPSHLTTEESTHSGTCPPGWLSPH